MLSLKGDNAERPNAGCTGLVPLFYAVKVLRVVRGLHLHVWVSHHNNKCSLSPILFDLSESAQKILGFKFFNLNYLLLSLLCNLDYSGTKKFGFVTHPSASSNLGAQALELNPRLLRALILRAHKNSV